MILTKTRDRNASGFAVVEKSEFLNRFNSFTSNVFNNFNWKNVIVAGGCVLGCLLTNAGNNYDSSDIDMFVYGLSQEEANAKVISTILHLVTDCS